MSGRPAWIAVASAEHVARGREGGFVQVCHGKRAPLARLRPGDGVVCYSPTVTFSGEDKLQAFTALGRVREGEPYQVERGGGFAPFRRDVAWEDGQPVQIHSLLTRLAFTSGRSNWGYAFRFGLLPIEEKDFLAIEAAMRRASAPAQTAAPHRS